MKKPLQNTIRWLSSALMLSALMIVGADSVDANIDGANGPITGFKQGKVMARSLVYGPNGKPILATFKTTGEVDEVIGEMFGPLADAKIMSADQYRAVATTYNNLKAQYYDAGNPHSVLEMPREYFQAHRFFTTTNQLVTKPTLSDDTRYVLVRAKGTMADPDPLRNTVAFVVATTDFVLGQFPIRMPPIDVPADIHSLLLNSNGEIIKQASTNIGFRAAWVRDTQDNTLQDTQAYRQTGQTPLGPVQGAMVYAGFYGPTSITDATGQYSAQYQSGSCPGSDYSITSTITALLQQSNFNPHGRYNSVYSISVPFDINCFGSQAGLIGSGNLAGEGAYVNTIGVLATTTDFNRPIDIHVDVMSLAGQGELRNPDSEQKIPLGETKYQYAEPPFDPLDPNYFDFNHDYVRDNAFRCGDHYNVYFGAPPENVDPCISKPDLKHALDIKPDFSDQGLLSSIAANDLKQIDLYVFRLSNGELITERKRLVSPNQSFQSSGVAANDATFYYNMLLRGPTDVGAARLDTADFSQWQSKAQVNPALRERRADHLRPGEAVQVVAINRLTGYVGTAETTLKNAAGNTSGALRVDVQNIVLRPPNIKIKAERTTVVEAGFTKGDEKNYLIGFEGSALKSDKVIVITSEWLDDNNKALPAALPGYTARLAKVAEPIRDYDADRLATVTSGSFVTEVSVLPGRHLQVVALPDAVALANDHFYVQVCGYAVEDRAQCSYVPNEHATGPLRYRPKYYVPVKVPLFDEVATRVNAINKLDGAPVYHWVYRPEMQFSVYELTVAEMRKTPLVGAATNLLTTTEQTLNATDTLKLIYDLVGQKYDPLQRFGPGRDLVFSLNGAEVHAQLGSNREALFDDLAYLNKLNPEDYVALGLIQNDDAANVLWEYVIAKLRLWADFNRNGEIDVDNSDDTAPEKPFIFWVNNDADFVLDKGNIRNDIVECSAETSHATCEEDDVNNLNANDDGYLNVSNTDDAHQNKIESMRDLEDFIPMQASFSPYRKDMNWSLRAVGVDVNVFSASWKKPRDDVSDIAQARVDAGGSREHFVFGLADGQSKYIPNSIVKEIAYSLGGATSSKGLVTLLVEGIKVSAATCISVATPCYLELALRDRNLDIVATSRLYLQFKEIKDLFEHWTLGDCEGQISGCVLQTELTHPGSESFQYDNAHLGLSTPGHKEYFALIHGWRMQPSERRFFARTTFKRLYWQGYQGRFGAVSWPTTYFTKPGWEGTPTQLTEAGLHLESYDTGETIARRAGSILANQWAFLRRDSSQINVLAHSMGNVVTSEALRQGPSHSVDTYLATQSAEVANAFAPDAPLRTGLLTGWNSLASDSGIGFYNGAPVSVINPPPVSIGRFLRAFTPDKFRFNNGSEHMLDSEYESPSAPHYYSGLGGKVTLVNFYSHEDAALSVWAFNQGQKPDVRYSYIRDLQVTDYFASTEQLARMTAHDSYLRLHLLSSDVLNWPADSAEILANIIAARSQPLGQQQGASRQGDPADHNLSGIPNDPTASNLTEVNSEVWVGGPGMRFTDRGYDHSAQFLSGAALRFCYWNRVGTLLNFTSQSDAKCP